jgi:ribosomal protein S18 acetylase RimI-like enzyme
MRIEPTPLPCEAFEAAVIVCFVVAPQRRRQGISRALLTAALASFGARGLKVVDAFPFKSGASELAADHYHGSLSLFLDQGFTVLRDDETLTAVRKMLR